MDELQVKLKSTPEIVRASIGPEVITVQVRQPNDPKNVDMYFYGRRKPKTPAEIARSKTGTADPLPFEWGEARPVKMKTRDIAELPSVLFSPSQVAWSRIPALAKEALKILEEIEQPKVEIASVSKVADSQAIFISIPVDGVRGSGTLRADNQGSIILAERR